jgi:aerotaxis receptor
MDAGAAVLDAALSAHGFASYEAFMWVMLCEELKSRDAAVAHTGRPVVRPLPSDQARREVGRPALRHLAEIYRDGCTAYEQLNRLYRRIDEFVALNETLGRKSAFINRLTAELRLSSINVALASTRLGNEGLSLSVISQHMGDTSGQVAGSVHGMVSGIATLSGRLRGVIFDIAAARLQVEMVLTFVHELLTQTDLADAWQERRAQIETLHRAFSTTIGHASTALHALEVTVHPLSLLAENLENYMMSLQVAQVSAIVESARISSHRDFLDIFVSIREQIDQTHDELLELSDALHRLDRLSNEAPPIARDVCHAVTRMEQDLRRTRVGEPAAAPPLPPPGAKPRSRPPARPGPALPVVAATSAQRVLNNILEHG